MASILCLGVQEECVYLCIAVVSHVHLFHEPRWPLQLSISEDLLVNSDHLLILEGDSSDGHQHILLFNAFLGFS